MPNKNQDVEYGQDTLPVGIRSRRVDNNNGLTMHILEAGFEVPGRPCVVLLHGFPELAYTWRKQLLPLAQAGFYVVAPDQRGFGRSVTTPVTWDDVPACYIGGASDWGVYQSPGVFEQMHQSACTRLLGVHLIEGAGHSLAEEQPEQVNRILLEFLQKAQLSA